MKIQIKEIIQLTQTLTTNVTPIFGKFNGFMDVMNGLKLIKGIKTFFTLKLVSTVVFNLVSNILDVVDFCLSISDLI